MKLLCIGDLHGRMPKIHYKDFDAVIFVGDVCDDRGFRPLKNQWVKALEKDPISTPNMGTFIEEKIGKRKADNLEKDSLKVGRKILEFLNSFGKPVFMVPGNWDQSYGPTKIKDLDISDYNNFKAFLDFWNGDKINPKLVRGLKNIKDCQFKLHKFKGVNIVGYGNSSNAEKPSIRKNKEYKKGELEKLKKAYLKIVYRLRIVYLKRDKKFPVIFITHNVPHNTLIDKIKIKGSKFSGRHLGSSVAKDFCNKYQPLLCIGGHIHEHFKKIRLKKTVAINAGYGKDANILIDIDEEKSKIRKITFYPKYKAPKQ